MVTHVVGPGEIRVNLFRYYEPFKHITVRYRYCLISSIEIEILNKKLRQLKKPTYIPTVTQMGKIRSQFKWTVARDALFSFMATYLPTIRYGTPRAIDSIGTYLKQFRFFRRFRADIREIRFYFRLNEIFLQANVITQVGITQSLIIFERNYGCYCKVTGEWIRSADLRITMPKG